MGGSDWNSWLAAETAVGTVVLQYIQTHPSGRPDYIRFQFWLNGQTHWEQEQWADKAPRAEMEANTLAHDLKVDSVNKNANGNNMYTKEPSIESPARHEEWVAPIIEAETAKTSANIETPTREEWSAPIVEAETVTGAGGKGLCGFSCCS